MSERILHPQRTLAPYQVPGLQHNVVDVSIEELAHHATAQPGDLSDTEITEDVLPESTTPLRRSPRTDTPKQNPNDPVTSRKKQHRSRYLDKPREARQLEQDTLGSSINTAAACGIKGHEYQGFSLIECDGLDPVKILDSRQRLLVFLPGRPKERWDDVHNDLWTAFTDHRRDGYDAVGAGVSLGNGTIEPGNLRLRSWELAVVEKLRKLPALRRLAGFVNRAFETALPKVRALYSRVLSLLIARNPPLRRNFQNSAFGGAHFNLGPVTVARRHHDHLNYILGPCPTTAYCPFNYKLGGHLVLWELGLVLEFPPGSTIFFPSALLEHSNVPIQPGEMRGSFTPYMATGLIHWVDNDFQLNSIINLQGSAVEKVGVVRCRETAFGRALKLLPVVEDVD